MADVKSEEYGTLQRLIDVLYAHQKYVKKVEALVTAEVHDLHPDLLELINNLPPGTYDRQTMCDQLNSAISGRAWGMIYGTVE